MSQIYIGILSGTSMDAIDVVAVDFAISPFKLLETHTEPFPEDLAQSLHSLCKPGLDEINRLGQLDRQVGFLFAKACHALLAKLQITKKDICAIGSHGQTVRHQPLFPQPFTLQIGDPNVIATLTGITTIADFRRRDMVCGGQGAPLTPAFHHFAFHSTKTSRAIVNIGGISNITFLPADPVCEVSGFDSGPGNTLLDVWAKQHTNQAFDWNGSWSKQGKINEIVLNRMLTDPYFQLPPPKSTGREYFNMSWLQNIISDIAISPQDLQTTLCELTACSIMGAIDRHDVKVAQILLCGGGAYNQDLVTRLGHKKGSRQLFSTTKVGVDPNWVEAIAFAWLARQTINGLPGNLPTVTGANTKTILGGIYPAV